jgi:MFS family permease
MKFFPSRFQWSVLLGNLFDHYDTALYGLLAPFFAHQFFPSSDPLTSIIMTYAVLPVGAFARPIGNLFFGFIGDFLGGKNAFTLSLLGVALVTISMAFLPTYDQVGIWAPMLLALARMLQSFFAAGEVSSGGVLLMENTEPERKNMMSGFYNSASMAGIMLSSAAVTILGRFGWAETEWRTLYLLGSLTLLFVYFLRRDTTYKNPARRVTRPKELFINLWNYKFEILAIAMVYGFSYSCFSIAFLLINALTPFVTGLSKVDAMDMNTFFMTIDFLLLPCFAYLGTFVSLRAMLLMGSMATILFGIPLFSLLEGASYYGVAGVRFLLMIIGVSFSATVLPWSQKLLPESVRFTGTGVAFSLGHQFLGVPTTAISLWVYQQTGMASSAGWYWIGLAVVSMFIALWVNAETKETLIASEAIRVE